MPYAKMDTNTVTKLTWIAKKAYDKTVRFTSLVHHLNEEFLKDCYKQLKKGKAAGVDGRTVESYTDEEIVGAIEQIVEAMKKRKYQPQPVRRVYIDKSNGEKRPLGIPTVIDKVVQLAVTRILEAVYEPVFLPVSFGYRPARDAHECLKEINHMVMGRKVNWIIEADIRGFFDHVDHNWMMECLDQRITDPNFKYLIHKFLKSGIMEEGKYQATDKGTPQGGIISPMLANIYLHYLLDNWFEKVVKKQVSGYVQLMRYADDFIIGVQHPHEAQAILKELEIRLAKFGLTLAGNKTRIIEFGRFAEENRKKRGEGKPETFDFLGFTHYCAQTRDGRFQVRVQTSSRRMVKASSAIHTWLKTIRSSITTKRIWEAVRSKLTGHYNYYGVSGNFESINTFYRTTKQLVFKWVNRRNRKRYYNWERFERYLSLYPLPKPKLTYVIYNTW